MKKRIAIALIMTLAVSTTAFAENVSQNGSSSADVKATYNDGADAGKIYSVDITWQGMDFTYTAADTVWNPQTHTYDPITEPYWSDGMITVTNHSNDAITATPGYAAESEYENITMDFSNESLKVATADNGINGAAGKAVTGSITVKPSGELPKGITDTKIGRITIVIS